MKSTTPQKSRPESEIQQSLATMKSTGMRTSRVSPSRANLRRILAGTLLLTLIYPTVTRANEMNVSWNWISGGPWSEDPIAGTENNYWFPEVTSTAGYHVLIGGPTTNYDVPPDWNPEVVISGWSEACKNLTLGFAQGYGGTLSVLSQQLAVDESVVVGATGRGTLFVSGPTAPGRVVSHGTSSIGNSATGVGVANIGGLWTINDDPDNHGTLEVGNFGTGTLNVLTGGRVTTRYAYVGRSNGGVGVASVSGPGAKLIATSIVYPSGGNGGMALFVGLGGTGNLNIQNGGKVESYHGSIGTYTSGRGHALITGAGSEWVSGSLQVGDFGTGALTIQDGGLATSISGTLGTYSTGSGMATVKGEGSEWVMTGDPTTSARLAVGSSGEGELHILDGGKVTSKYAYVGSQGTSEGYVIVSGAGSEWVASGVVYPDGSNGGVSLYVGSGGDGNVMVQNQGKLSSYAGDIGSGGGGTGTVTVTGNGSEWISSSISVGRYGPGNLNVMAGGKVSGVNSYLGSKAYSGGLPLMGTGVATVDGAGSIWFTTNSIQVGYGGAGTLNVKNGGKIAAPGIYLSNGESTSVGTVNVTGTPGMRGTLETRFLSGNSRENSSLTFDGGVLLGSDDFQVSGFLSGKLRAESGGMHIDTQAFHGEIHPPIHGAGGLTKSGTGSLSLYGGNAYTGVTEVKEGLLYVENGLQGPLVVRPAGTFSGAGVIPESAIIEGKLDLGGETLHVQNCTWSGSVDGKATMRMVLEDSSSGQLVVDQGLVKEGENTYCFDFDYSGLHSASGKTYVLMKFGSTTFNASDFSYINLSPGLVGTFAIGGGELRFHVTALPAPLLGAALDSSLTWASVGDSPWVGQRVTTHDGTDAAQSGTIDHDQESWMETTVAGPGSLSFWWKVSSEGGYDWLEFYIDGVLQSGRISGTVDWVQKIHTLGSGSHTLRWRYTKDGSVVSGADSGWVDQVVWTTGGMPYANWPLLTTLPADRRGALDRNGPLALQNLLAFAMGLNPMTAAPADLPAMVSLNGGTATFRYRRAKNVVGTTLTPMTSTNLGAWDPAAILGTSLMQDGGDWEVIEVQVPAPPEGRLFFQLQVSQTGP